MYRKRVLGAIIIFALCKRMVWDYVKFIYARETKQVFVPICFY